MVSILLLKSLSTVFFFQMDKCINIVFSFLIKSNNTHAFRILAIISFLQQLIKFPWRLLTLYGLEKSELSWVLLVFKCYYWIFSTISRPRAKRLLLVEFVKVFITRILRCITCFMYCTCISLVSLMMIFLSIQKCYFL